MTKGSPGGIIVKLSGAGARGGKPENRIGTAWNGFRGRKALEKSSKNLKKVLDKRTDMRYNIQAVTQKCGGAGP